MDKPRMTMDEARTWPLETCAFWVETAIYDMETLGIRNLSAFGIDHAWRILLASHRAIDPGDPLFLNPRLRQATRRLVSLIAYGETP